jgi:hypothetical protein
MESLVKRAPVHYYADFLSPETAELLRDELHDLDILHRHMVGGDADGVGGRWLGRNTAVFADNVEFATPVYWGDGVKVHEWSPIVKTVRDKVCALLGHEFNICLVNQYKTGSDSIGWHADREEKGDVYCIASVSVGARRTFSFKTSESADALAAAGVGVGVAEDEDEGVVDVDLASGSLIVMNHPCQDRYWHSLRKMKSVHEERLNLTFRVFHYD